MYTSFCIASTSLVLASLIFSSLILHQRLLPAGFLRFPRTASLNETLLVLAWAADDGDGELAVGDKVARSSVCRPRLEESFDDSDSRAERATDRKLLVSGSRAAEVGPAVLLGGNWPLLLSLEDSPERLPFARESDELDAADVGDIISGVVNSVLLSRLGSSNRCEAFN